VKKIVFITPADARYGFSLTGVRQMVLAPPELGKTLRTLVDDTAVGLVVIDERLTSSLAPARLRAIERRWPGVVIVLPAPEKAALPEEDYALRLIRRAIGYQVRLTL